MAAPAPSAPRPAAAPPAAGAADRGPLHRRTPRHTTHHQHFPERVAITRPHHPFHGQSLEVLRQARMPAGLQFVLILPDGSKSLIPADWTDFKHPPGAPQDSQLVASFDDLLRLRGLVDALLRRSPDLPVRSQASQEGHATTQSELQRHPDSGDAPVGAVRRRPKARRHRDAGAPPCQSDRGPAPGADQ
ncbi:MAG: Y4bD/Y4pK family protein [Acidobacteriia bacterium]|nr:Y4bD/Y4pK family protein [Terriglobia bacterium]